MKQAAESYADALLALARDPGQAQRFEASLEAFAALYEGSAELRDFLHNPEVPRAAQKDVLSKLAPAGPPPAALNCLYLMVDRGRIGLLPQMAAAYKQRRAAVLDTLVIHASSPQPLDNAQTERIRQVFTRRFGARDAIVETSVDPALIGGVRVQIGDMLFEDSLLGRLAELRRAIL